MRATPDHPAAWRGAELFDRPDFTTDWSAYAQVRSGVAALRDRTDAVPSPVLGERLAQIRHDLEHGSGIVRVRGAGLVTGDAADERAFLALTREVGTPVSQDPKGSLLLRVEDKSYGSDDPRVRGPHTAKRLSFHTDRCDVIAFACVRDAASGGENDVISSVVLYQEMARRHPELLEVLERDFVYIRHTVDGGNERPFTKMPVFARHEGHFAGSLLRVLIDRADRDPELPDMTDEQRLALDTLEEVAEDPELYARFRLDPGDVLFLNNWVTFHRRTAFVDRDDPEMRRLLLRVWLSVPNSRPLDPRYAEHFGATEAGAIRGGMKPAGE